MRKVFTVGFIFVGLLASACDPPPYSKYPLSKPGEYKNDERLMGLWHIARPPDDPGYVYLHFSKDKNGWMDMIWTKTRPEVGNSVLYYIRGFTTEIKGKRYLNIDMKEFLEMTGAHYMEDYFKMTRAPILEKAKLPENELKKFKERRKEAKKMIEVKKYLIVLYDFTKAGGMVFHFMDKNFTYKQIKEGRIKGFIPKWLFEVALTAPPAELFRFVKESDTEKLFDNSEAYERFHEFGPWRRVHVP